MWGSDGGNWRNALFKIEILAEEFWEHENMISSKRTSQYTKFYQYLGQKSSNLFFVWISKKDIFPSVGLKLSVVQSRTKYYI